MVSFKRKFSQNTKLGDSTSMGVKVFRGTTVSGGVGIGGIYVSQTSQVQISREKVSADKIEEELVNLEVAICKTFIEIYDLYNGFSDLLSDEEKEILQVYNAILDDIYFFEELKETIRTECVTAAYAIDQCTQKVIKDIQNSENEHAKLRIADLNDVRMRLIQNATPHHEGVLLERIHSSHIVVVKELTPTLAVSLGRKKVQGVIAQEGAGYLSHAAIILRGQGIPTLQGIQIDEIATETGKLAIIDAFEGVLMVDPGDEEINQYRETVQLEALNKQQSQQESDTPVQTKDGHLVGLSANISHIDDFRLALDAGMDGVGLVRTETLFIHNKNMPSEKRQTRLYKAFVKALSPKPIIFRVFDIGGDKRPFQIMFTENYKDVKSRGVRWCLKHEDHFRAQLRAILKASAYGNVSVSLPMLESVEEIRLTRKILQEEMQEIQLSNEKTLGTLSIGVVLETKRALQNLDAILQEVDFLSIGTNDLLNSVMGFSRSAVVNGIKAYFEPNFIKTLFYVIKRAMDEKKPVSICGEMAADPLATMALVGMGVSDLSVAPGHLVNIKRCIRNITYEDSVQRVATILNAETSDEVVAVLAKNTDRRFLYEKF